MILKSILPLPEPLIYGNATRVMSLRDGTKKQSKSDASELSRILLTDSDDDISSKIRKAKSDSDLIPEEKDQLQNKPECLNLINILSACLDQSIEKTLAGYAGKEYSKLKNDLADTLIQVVGPVRKEILNLLDNKDELNKILQVGSEKASTIAGPIIKEVYKIVGFRQTLGLEFSNFIDILLAMFVQTEPTPNPATLKFLPGKEVMTDGTMFYQNQESASNSPLAMNLFNIKGVEGVFFGSDFITITKGNDNDWTLMKPAILGCIIEHFTMNKPVISENTASTEHVIDENDSDVVKKIKELLDSKVRPAVAMDGGDIIFDKYNEGIVFLQMQGACQGCPSSTATLKMGIENMLKHYIPEVREVRPVEALVFFIFFLDFL